MENKYFKAFSEAVAYVAGIIGKEVKDEEQIYDFNTFASQAMKDRVFEDESAKMDSEFYIIVSPERVFYSETFNYALEKADSCPFFKHIIKLANVYGERAYVQFINYKGREK